jgi:glycosyltransferase involved in cell wall biosynthesis
MDAVDASDFTLHVEWIVEPYTGLPLLVVGGHAPSAEWKIDVRYDAETAVTIAPKLQQQRFQFASQLLIEPTARVRVVAVGPSEIPLFDEALVYINRRPSHPPRAERGLVSKLLRMALRGPLSLLTGKVLTKAWWSFQANRVGEFLRKVRQKLRYRALSRRYHPRPMHDSFVERSALTPPLRTQLEQDGRQFAYRPKVSILMPVYNVRPDWFRAAVASVQGQIYDNWELCIADDASTKPELIAEFDRLRDKRIKLTRLAQNGHICTATNTAAATATGEFVALLDHDDLLAPDTLLEVVRALQTTPDADLIYSDEDKIDAAGRRYDPQFKPDWSPELILSYNYVNHFTVIRRKAFEAAGRFRVGYEGSQDHDLLLRVTERTDRVVHVPKILYHWRAHAESTAQRATQKSIVHTSGRRAVEEALQRRGIAAGLYVPAFAERLGLPVLALDGDDNGPSVAVIVHGADAAATARAVKENTSYRNFTVYLVLDDENPGDALNRMAAARTEDVLLFLAAGVEPAHPKWLSRLVAHLPLTDVGAVGGLIRTPAGTVVSAGTVLGLHDGTGPGNACRGVTKDEISYYFYAEVTRNVAAVGRGCLLTPRATFEALGGFDADRFGLTLFDVDYCTRLRGLGLRCVHVAGAELAAADDGDRTDDPLELLAFKRGHGRPADPYSNPHFSEAEAFRPSGDTAVSLPRATRPLLKVVVAAHNMNNPEGAPRYLSEIVLGLRDRLSVEPSLWSPQGGAGEGVYAAVGVPVTIAAGPWGQRFVDGHWTRKEYEAAQKELIAHLKAQRPDAVIANTLLTFPMVEAAARLGIPSVWIIHESYSPNVLGRLFSPFGRWRAEAAFGLASRVVPASHDTAKLFQHLNTRGNFRVIHNGIPPLPLAPRACDPTAKKRILSVGTVCARKGQHTLIEAAAILAKTRSDFVVDVVGMRNVVPYAAYIRQLTARRKLDGVVNLVGETNQVADYFHRADVFVCTSYMETFSRSILEAEAYGLPIVTTNCQGIDEQVKWGFNALRFDHGDAPALAAQLARVLDDDRLREGMARRSLALFENHLSYDEMLDRYDLVVRSAVGAAALTRLPPKPAAAARRAA